MHVYLFRDTIEYGRLAAILLRFLMFFNYYSNILEPILFKLGTKNKYYGLHMHDNLCRDTIQYGRQTAILLRFFHVFQP